MASGKSRLWTAEQFRDAVLEPAEDAEASALRREIERLVGSWTRSIYNEAIGKVSDDIPWEKAPDAVRRKALSKLFTTLTSRKPLDVGLARHILRRARRSRVRDILPGVLESAAFLLPVFRDVGLYLDGVLSPTAVRHNLGAFEATIDDDKVALPFARHWLRWLFASRAEFAESKKIEKFVMGVPEDLRSQAAFAKTTGRESWIKKRKDDWRNLGPWERRAPILAGEVLSKSERNVWMDAIIRNPPDPLDAIVAKFVRSR